MEVAWIARETYNTIPLTHHDLLASDAMQLQKDAKRNELIKNFTPEDCLEPSKETIAFVQSEVIKSLQHRIGESRMQALIGFTAQVKEIEKKSSKA